VVKMVTISVRKQSVSLLVILLLFSQAVFAQEARLTSFRHDTVDDELYVDLEVEGAFTEKMKKVVLSGVPTTFIFYVSVYQDRSWWMDRKIADIEVSHTIKFDNLKKQFAVYRSWKGKEPEIVESFSEAREIMTKVERFSIMPLSLLEKGGLYRIQSKVELSKVTLPFYLHYVLLFVSLWDFETDWYSIAFTY
jgi:hypothetical protein